VSTPAARRPRADAERNRERVLAAARAQFAEHGEQAQMTEIARAAGVGVGTLYRHFPTQHALVEALAERRFAEIAEHARTECRRDPERGEGVARYLRHVARVLTEDRGLSAAIAAARGVPETEPRGAARAELEDAVAELVRQDQAAGTLRADVTTADVYLLAGALSATIRTDSGDPDRLLDLVFTGLTPR
jgi:AcrR family transcriptional regulator